MKTISQMTDVELSAWDELVQEDYQIASRCKDEASKAEFAAQLRAIAAEVHNRDQTNERSIEAIRYSDLLQVLATAQSMVDRLKDEKCVAERVSCQTTCDLDDDSIVYLAPMADDDRALFWKLWSFDGQVAQINVRDEVAAQLSGVAQLPEVEPMTVEERENASYESRWPVDAPFGCPIR